MKALLTGFLLVLFMNAWAQNKPVRIVFDITSKDTLAHQAALRHVSGMSSSYPGSKFEVVVYGGALDMLISKRSTVREAIEKLSSNKNVAFMACEMTMKRHKVAKDELVQGVIIVPDAILEIVNKQAEGWGYIKEAHN